MVRDAGRAAPSSGPGGDGVDPGCPEPPAGESRKASDRSSADRLATASDGERALSAFAQHHLSHGLGLLDALIAATAIGLGATLVTYNLKHYRMLTSLRMEQPYAR